ncbi:MAG: UDP-glucose--hexose-1-phosphate uridylyltransferase [Pseudomonadota bacterium]
MTDQPHRRYNPLTDSWVLVSPHRTQRPWQGQQETAGKDERPHYDPQCYLCPGNTRSGGQHNPDYADVFVFDNDFPALLATPDASGNSDDALFRRAAVAGTCRVICYSPRHDLTMADLGDAALRQVVNTWAQEYEHLSQSFNWVQIFENRGSAMGCSNPHPHGQIWATDTLPTEAERESATQASYRATHGSDLLGDYADREIAQQQRVIVDNEHWLVVVPYWAVWPFEVIVIARDEVATLAQLSDRARDSLASVLGQLCQTYDAVFDTAFPYSMGWHNAPADGSDGWRLHAHFYPPLLRSATVKKFMVGYEMLGEPQRDLTPEQAADTLRAAMARIA